MSFASLENWSPALTPGPATAVVARDEAARQLARSLLLREDPALAELRGVASSAGQGSAPATIVVVGKAELLPWADGAIYLGHSTAAGGILWPVLWTPPIPVALLEKALLASHSDLSAPLALVPQWGLLVPLGLALPIERDHLHRFLNAYWPAPSGEVAAP